MAFSTFSYTDTRADRTGEVQPRQLRGVTILKTPHKHAELIKAWADGAEIEYWALAMRQWVTNSTPKWYEDTLYRIKPEPKPDVVQCWYTSPNDWFYQHSPKNNLRLTFDGETGKLKAAEVIA